ALSHRATGNCSWSALGKYRRNSTSRASRPLFSSRRKSLTSTAATPCLGGLAPFGGGSAVASAAASRTARAATIPRRTWVVLIPPLTPAAHAELRGGPDGESPLALGVEVGGPQRRGSPGEVTPEASPAFPA